MKRGDIRVLGAASYATPLLSTMFLILAGFRAERATSPSPRSDLPAAGWITCGEDMIGKRSAPP